MESGERSRKRTLDEVLAGDEAPDEEMKQADGDVGSAFTPSPDAVDGVHWIVMGGVGMGGPDTHASLSLTVAAASRERFQSAWTAATRDERIALLALREEGKKRTLEQSEQPEELACSMCDE